MDQDRCRAGGIVTGASPAAAGIADQLVLSQRFTTTNGDVVWDVFGDGDPVVLVHGFPGSPLTWRNIVPRLAASHTVYVFGLLGVGEASRRDGQRVGLVHQARMFTDLAESWGLTAPTVVAHDAGCAVTLGAHLFEGLALTRLMLLDPAIVNPCISENSLHARRFPEAYHTLPARLHELIVRAQLSTTTVRELPEETVRAYLEPWLGGGQSAYYRFLEQLDVEYLDRLEAALPDVACPTTIVWGEEDTWIPPTNGERIQQAIPGSALTMVPRAGHFILDDAPDEIGDLVIDMVRTG
jgi:pimeloyl-ACP methyl ester carboxylesterase